jgi:hypothetical protein
LSNSGHKSCQKVVTKIVKKLSKNCQKVFLKLSKSCQINQKVFKILQIWCKKTKILKRVGGGGEEEEDL